MFKYSSPSIAALVAQIKRGPSRLRLRPLLNVDFLMSVIEAGKSYPFEFICHALTGYRPNQGQPELLRGDPLVSDLITLAEDISASVTISSNEWPEPVYTVPELAARFDVSTKTIFRWRRRGLVGWRFCYADRRARLAFPERCIRRFVGANAELVKRGASFSQLSSKEREQIVSRARALVDEGQRTVNAVAKLVASETGRAVETIRLILKSHDDAHPRAGVFNRSNLRVDADDVRLAIWEAYHDGVSLENLSERFDKPVAWIYRALTQMRARELKSRPIEYVGCEDFALAGADDRYLDTPNVRAPHGEVTVEKRIPRDLPPYLQQLFRLPLLSTAGEGALFRKFNYLKFKADQAREALDPETADALALDQIEALLTEAQAVKNQIVQANLRLVVSIAKRHVTPNDDFFEVVSDGNISLMRAVDKFDFNRGFKFSTYASWAIMKNFARSAPEQKIHRDRYQTGREELLDIVPGHVPDEPENDHLPAIRATIERMLSALDERERTILRHRYGLESRGEPQTLEQIGKSFGVSKERVRQLEARAMAKLRHDFQIDAAKLLSA